MSTMDDDAQLADSREQLLNAFRASLSKPMADRYFDEDDLIEIFDYAGDTGDDYLRMEALMCGARFHPDSDELLARRAIFYSQYSDSVRDEFFKHSAPDDTAGPESLILEILALRANEKAKSEQVVAKLEEILKSRPKLEDEEVIQLVEAASDMGGYQWLKSRMPELRKKASYLTGLLYEAGMAAENNSDYAYAAKLLEELTMIEPFNSYYWMLLGRQYAELDEAEKALSALDYSLAINPDAPHSLLMKARFLFALEHRIEEIIPMLEKAVETSKGATDAVRMLANVYHLNKQDDKARELIINVLSDPELGQGLPLFGNADTYINKEVELIPELLMYGVSDPAKWLDAFYEANEDNSQPMWEAWASKLSETMHDELAMEVLKCYERNSGIKVPTLLSIEVPYKADQHQKTLEAIQQYLEDTFSSEIDEPEVLAMHVITLMRMGEKKKAKALCKFIMQEVQTVFATSLTMKLRYEGLLCVVGHAMEEIEMGDDEDVLNFDPFEDFD